MNNKYNNHTNNTNITTTTTTTTTNDTTMYAYDICITYLQFMGIIQRMICV